MGNIFKLVGNLVVNGAAKAKKDIEDTGKSAEKASGTFAKVGAAIKDGFNGEKVKAFGVSLEKLNNRISGQHNKLDLLKQKYTDLYLTQGKSSKEAQKTASEIEKLSAELSRNEKALDEARSAADSFDKTLAEVKNTLGEAGKEGERSGEGIRDKWNDAIENFKKAHPVLTKIATGVGAVGAAVIAAGKAMIELADSTREYRIEMGKLETAFGAVGYSAKAATETYRTLYSVIGETDQSVEAANHLARLCYTEEQLAQMTEACIGVFATFGDSLPLEGLTEAANETAKTGVVTGQLADALNWAGYSEEEFNIKLAACNTERERAVLITETLLELYGESAATYKKNNKEILAAQSAQEKLNAAYARWGEVFEPFATAWKEFVASVINFAADGLEEAADITHGVAEEMAGVSETTAEATEKILMLEAELAELGNKPRTSWTNFDYERYDMLMMALSEARSQYDALAEAERRAGEEAENASETAVSSAEEVVAAVDESVLATDQYIADLTAVYEKFCEVYEGVYSQVSGWFKPFEEAAISVTTSVGEMMTAMQTQIDFNNAYADNLQTLKDYGLGALSEAFQSYGAEGAAYAQAIVSAVEEAGGAATEEGQAIIQGFAEMNRQLEESQTELTQTITLLNGELEAELKSVQDTYESAIEGLDMAPEAAEAARSTFQAFLESMNKEIPGIVSAVTGFGSQITNAIQQGIGTINIPFTLTAHGDIPRHETGLDYVPYDNYLAFLHKGETVLTAEEARAWRAGKEYASNENQGNSGSGGVTIIQNITAVAQTPVELASATAAYFEQARWAT